MRQYQEQLEAEILSSRASLSAKNRGRMVPEEPCFLRTAYQRDRDRITHCKAFRRLKHKTQVFIAPEGDHYRTRLTHTLEVAQIARTVARSLRLNEDLTEAIALGHDLGHTPFGHAGEEELNRIHPGGFCHNCQSLRVVDHLEKLNLTWEVRDGIVNHSGKEQPATPEGQVVRICDRIAYLNHDIDDALRAGILMIQELPKHCLDVLGRTNAGRINSLVLALVANSKDSNCITLGAEMTEVLDCLRDFMFKRVYIDSRPKGENYKARHVLNSVYHLFLEQPQLLPEMYRQEELRQGICDYIAGMTDRYVVSVYKSHFLPTPW